MDDTHFDWIVIGSGFGGSVSALRLAEKGYSVLVIEKGRRWSPEDFPKTNWDLRRWMWQPEIGMRGFFQMSFFSSVTGQNPSIPTGLRGRRAGRSVGGWR